MTSDMRRMHLRKLLLPASLVAAAAGVSSTMMRAQPQPQATTSQPSFRAEANFVRVDVYPTVNGLPVRDLTAADFELFEDGAPQAVAQFERVDISTITTREERRDPGNVTDGKAQAADPRRRLFVLYLDTWHTTAAGAEHARQPLLDMLERLVGPDDLFAVMTPDMDPRQLTFARRTEALDAILSRKTSWGLRDSQMRPHPDEQEFELCYPTNAPAQRCADPAGTAATGQRQEITQTANAYRGVAAQLIARRREDEVLNSLERLVRHLGANREGRTAVIMATQGYLMFAPKPDLLRQQECDAVPGLGQVGTGPDGRITTDVRGAQARRDGGSTASCMTRAMRLAMLDNRERFRLLTQDANRYNVSFYPIDTRGLSSLDMNLTTHDDRTRADPGEWYNATSGSRPGGALDDVARLGTRVDSLRLLAENTDGLAVVNTNDLRAGARRVVEDLSSYYLLGYYSTNERLDGKWRTIRVQVKRPGVSVRARKGYRALRAEEVTAAPLGTGVGAYGSTAGVVAAAAEASVIEAAIASVGQERDNAPWRSRVAWLLDTGTGESERHVRLWVTTELGSEPARDATMAQGGVLAITVSSGDGATVAEQTVSVAPGMRTTAVDMATSPLPAGLGELLVRLRLTPPGGAMPLTDSIRITLAGQLNRASPRLARANPSTRQRFVPTADSRFRRGEKLRVEVPLTSAAERVEAALLDRAGSEMKAIPVNAVLVAPDEAGIHWATADVSLVPLAPGTYVMRVDVSQGGVSRRSLSAFKVVP